MITQAHRPMRWSNPWRLAGWGVAAALLLAPAVAMRFTDQVKWTPLDFLFAAVMIGGVGIALELGIRHTRVRFYRGGAAVALAAGFVMIWVNAAVGIIGREDNLLNWLYVGIVGVALVGSVAARFRPAGMARAMAIATLATVLVGVVAIIAGDEAPPGRAELALIHVVFIAMFAASAALFRAAARREGLPHYA